MRKLCWVNFTFKYRMLYANAIIQADFGNMTQAFFSAGRGGAYVVGDQNQHFFAVTLANDSIDNQATIIVKFPVIRIRYFPIVTVRISKITAVSPPESGLCWFYDGCAGLFSDF